MGALTCQDRRLRRAPTRDAPTRTGVGDGISTGTSASILVSMMILNEGFGWSDTQLFIAEIKRIAHMYAAHFLLRVVAVRSDQI